MILFQSRKTADFDSLPRLYYNWDNTVSEGDELVVLRRRQEKPADDRDEKDDNSNANIQQVQAHLDALERRLDNIDSMVTAVAERVMSRPMVINVTCPHCGKNVEIALIGTQKPTR